MRAPATLRPTQSWLSPGTSAHTFCPPQLSLDGQIWSDSKVPFHVVGDGAGIRVDAQDSGYWTQQSTDWLLLNPINVTVVDSVLPPPQGPPAGGREGEGEGEGRSGPGARCAACAARRARDAVRRRRLRS